MQAHVTPRQKRSALRTAAKIYFAPLIAVLYVMAGMLVLGLAFVAVQIFAALFRYLHL
jgi:hypothetical protein